MTNTEQVSPKSLCVIGAGAAGLCALRHAADRSNIFETITCFEQTKQVGGTWNYTEEVGNADFPVHTSMYRDLTTNLPMQIMEFPDFPSGSEKSFVHHTEVSKYLQDYAEHFDLLKYVKFNHQVIHFSRFYNVWKVRVLDLESDDGSVEIFHFDHVFICPGRYSRPLWPEIPSIRTFKGKKLHAHDYRFPESYRGQKVAVIGGGPSGVDITLEISPLAERVIFINRAKNRQYETLPDNVHQVKGTVVEFTAKTMKVCLADNKDEIREYGIDSVIFATGYKSNLDELWFDQFSTDLRFNPDDTIDGIYRHLINIQHPSMACLAVPVGAILPFPLYHQQVLFVLKMQFGEDGVRLPSKTDMILEVEADIARQTKLGIPDRERHTLPDASSLMKYIRSLERDADLVPLKPVIFKLFSDVVYKIQPTNISAYKDTIYRLVSDEDYVEV